MKSILLHLVTVALLNAELMGQEIKYITLHVMDERRLPVENARAVISFVGAREDDEHIGPTDRDGRFFAQGKPLVGVYLAASKDGYYPARFDNSRSDHLPPDNTIEKVFVLPRVIKPIALLAKRSGGWGAELTVPAQNEWIGYDFETGDWMQPHGNGKTADLEFRFKTFFNGWKYSDKDMANSRRINGNLTEEVIRLNYGKWDGELDISFPGEKEGLYEETNGFLAYSKMKLPHEAPVDGYQPTWHYTANTYSPTTLRDNVGFFLRTRVKLDENGNIISANYAKVIGDFRFSPANGAMQFLYY